MIFLLRLRMHETIYITLVRDYDSIIFDCRNSPCSSVFGSCAHTFAPLPLQRTPWLPIVVLPLTSNRRQVIAEHLHRVHAGVWDKIFRKEVAAGNAMYLVARRAVQAAAGAIPAAAGINKVSATQWYKTPAAMKTS